MSRRPLGATRAGILFLGIGGAALGAALDLGLIFDRPLAQPVLDLLMIAFGYWARAPVDYSTDHVALNIILIAALSALWLAICTWEYIRLPAEDRALDRYVKRHEGLDDARRATMIPDRDPPT